MTKVNKPLILVTNDDGIFSKGIRSLVESAQKFGDVLLVAPDKPQSGMGHAITINNVLRMQKSDLFADVKAYTCTGTPVDCVKLAIYEILKRKPDILLSGINHGENTSTNVLYSGTMSAAVEGAMEEIPSIGFSLADFDSNADFSASQAVAETIIRKVLENGLAKGVCLNVNVPKVSLKQLKGIKVCRAAKAFWEDRFDKRLDQHGNPYYWLTGEFLNTDLGEDTDLFALKEHYASVVPVGYDLTAYHVMSELNTWKF